MTSPVERFERIAETLGDRDGVERNRRGSLVRGGVRAMTSRGQVVVKLPAERVIELVAKGTGRHYKDQVNTWLELDDDLSEDNVRALVTEALEG